MHKGGQPYNSNAQKRGAFLRALTLELAQNPEQLRKAVRKLLEHAANGEPWAITTVADRLDGKPISGMATINLDASTDSSTEYFNQALEDLLSMLEKKLG
jgi:hypothetical protein